MPNLSTPVLWYPGQTEVDLQEEIDLMLVRAKWTSAFLKNEIHADTFLDFLNEQGYDVFDLADDWGLGDDVTS
ncbi:hypothetical protein [Aulosira sp. FACHB-615]|uniref:hypothetical protein n=1 Tax=Aulosira sp. FACHB-615 TaxID=2692777 RepID=UPI0016882BE8|nr:hypothetical protein [Aulosira sp. FACHB-615]MBD2492395.1 hypothetical protein [Aulosira sp. FACHB-615]